MAKINYFFDDRTSDDGKSPVKIRVTSRNTKAEKRTGVAMTPDEWRNAQLVICSASPSRRMTTKEKFLHDQYIILENALLELRLKESLDAMPAKEILAKILNIPVSNPEPDNGQSFLARYRRFAETRSTPGTRRIYDQTMKKILEFDPGADRLQWEDITKDWLTDFDTFLSRNTGSALRNRHFRNIRAVFNDAIDNDITTLYPFRKFKMPKVGESRKRALTRAQLKLLRDYPVEPWQEEYRDLFMLMFYLIGINSVDLLTATEENVVNGRFEYTRAKTHKKYSIKIEPEAQAIIDKYRGDKYLLRPLERYKSHVDYMHHMNDALQKIGPYETVPDKVGKKRKIKYDPLFPDLTSYWARHAWATLASELDIPIETISKALGHSFGAAVTNIYIRFNDKKVDKANRKVLDSIK